MAIYRYSHESLVDTVQILTNEKGGLRAYLYADNGADTEKLRLLKQALRGEGYKCVPTLNDGKPVLEVRGFKKADELMNYLGGMHAVKGTPEVAAEASDVRTSKQKWGNRTLTLAGISFNIGDISYLFYKGGPLVEKWADKEGRLWRGVDVVAGIGYGLGSLCLTFFGSKDQSINTITAATSKVERFSRTQGFEIAPESSIAFVNHEPDRGTWGNLKHLIGRYPSESLNAIYVGVGLCMSAASFYHATRPISMAGLEEDFIKYFKKNNPGRTPLPVELAEGLAVDFKHAKSSQKWDRIDVGLGAVTATSAILGLAVKEQKRLPGDPKRHGIGGVVDWIREKPLRATGIGYGIATLCHAVATAGKWTDKTRHAEKKLYLGGRVIFIGTNVISEILLAFSSKGHGVGIKPDSSINESVISTAAELVLRQPQGKREAVIQQLSGYIASPEVLAMKAEDVEQSIRQHIAELDKNPWTKHYVASATGEMVEMAPTAEVKMIKAAELMTDSTQKPTSTVGNVEYVAKQQAVEHSLA